MAKTKQRKTRRNVSRTVVHIKAMFDSTTVTITGPNGDELCWASSGTVGFKGSRKSTLFAAQRAAETAASAATKYGVKEVEVKVRTGSGRESAITAIQASGLLIKAIEDETPLLHNIDPEMLVGLSTDELEALSDSLLAPSAQARLDELLDRNAQHQLQEAEVCEPDRLLERVDRLTVLKPEPDTPCSITRPEPRGRDGLHSGGSSTEDSQSVLEPVAPIPKLPKTCKSRYRSVAPRHFTAGRRERRFRGKLDRAGSSMRTRSPGSSVLCGDFTSMQVDGAAGDGQPQPDAAAGPAAIAFDANKWLENRSEQVVRHAGPMIAHADRRPCRRLNSRPISTAVPSGAWRMAFRTTFSTARRKSSGWPLTRQGIDLRHVQRAPFASASTSQSSTRPSSSSSSGRASRLWAEGLPRRESVAAAR